MTDDRLLMTDDYSVFVSHLDIVPLMLPIAPDNAQSLESVCNIIN